jgi:hypothetical protein
MTEIQNPKQLVFDPPPVDLDIVIWSLEFVISDFLRNHQFKILNSDPSRLG